MTNNTNLEENIEGAKNFREWKYIVLLILEEHDLENCVKEEGLGNREDPGLILLCHTNKRPTVLALLATTCVQVAVSPETAMWCRRIRFLQAEEGYYCTFSLYK